MLNSRPIEQSDFFDKTILSMINLKYTKKYHMGDSCTHDSCIDHEKTITNAGECACDSVRSEEYCSCNTTCSCNSD